LGRPEYDDGARKWRTVRGLAEPDAAAEVTDGLGLRHIVVPPCRIGARGDERDDGRAGLRAFIRFRYPAADLTAVWRIHPTCANPIMREAVVGRRIERATLRVLRDRANVERETKLGVERREQIRRRFP